jgi:tetratricopeptide (TPR) repeat protein
LQICIGLGSFFCQIRDLTKAVVFLQNSLALLKSITLADVQNKYRSLILYHMSLALRKSGSFMDARNAAEVRARSTWPVCLVQEALRLSTENGHQPVQARCLHSLGDMHLEQGERQAAMMHYEAAYGLLRAMEDRLGQVQVLASMARAAADLHRHDSRTCECQALQLNKKCLDLAKDIGCKVLVFVTRHYLNINVSASDAQMPRSPPRTLCTTVGRRK